LRGIPIAKMSTFGIHRLGWLMVSKRFPWNAKYEPVHRWLASRHLYDHEPKKLTSSRLQNGVVEDTTNTGKGTAPCS